jgi:hypothetical protein
VPLETELLMRFSFGYMTYVMIALYDAHHV